MKALPIDFAIKAKIRKGIIKDLVIVFSIITIWFLFKRFFDTTLGFTHNVKIDFLYIDVYLYSILYYMAYGLAVFFGTKYLIGAVDRYIFYVFIGRVRKRFLATKVANFLIYTIAIMMILDNFSIDTKFIAAFGGALSIGIGFGLQKITSNFVSGVILFVEQSIRIDDVVELTGGIVGTVKQTSPRYTLVETFDGKDIFVPNEEFVINKVINWTYSSNSCRDDVTIKVFHGSDLSLVEKIISGVLIKKQGTELATNANSDCYVSGYDESGVMFLIRIWYADVKSNTPKIKSGILREIVQKLTEANIKMPAHRFEGIFDNIINHTKSKLDK